MLVVKALATVACLVALGCVPTASADAPDDPACPPGPFYVQRTVGPVTISWSGGIHCFVVDADLRVVDCRVTTRPSANC